jgi:hypothetical protein
MRRMKSGPLKGSQPEVYTKFEDLQRTVDANRVTLRGLNAEMAKIDLQQITEK